MDLFSLNNMDMSDVVTELYAPVKYRDYLRVMSRFSSYSRRNIFLIYKQMPHATKLADFKSWKEQYGRTVIRGSKSIKINVPIEQKPKKKFVEKIDSFTGTAMLDENGKRIMEEIIIEAPVQFKQISMMDISQTEGSPVLFLAGDVLSDKTLIEVFKDVLKTMSTLNEQFDFYEAVKQITHERLENADSEKVSFIVDSVVLVVCRRFGIETDLDFIGVAQLLDMETLENIGKYSDSLIAAIEDRFAAVCKERGLDPMTLPQTSEVKPQESRYIKELHTEKLLGGEFSRYPAKPYLGKEEKTVAETEPAIIQITTKIVPTTGKIPLIKQLKSDESTETPPLKYLPDTSITVAECNEYGYTRPELLPVTKDHAVKFFLMNMTVYLLYENNTESMAHYFFDIQNHDGIFGIAYGAWLNSREYVALASGNPEAQREAEFIYDSGNTFAIYQTDQSNSPTAYKSYEELQEKGFDINRHNYNLVYVAPLPDSPSDTPAGLFMWVNSERLENYTGRALAISDVLSIKKDEIITSYYANGRTFKELLSFIGEEGRISVRDSEVIEVEQKTSVIPIVEKKPQSQSQPEPLIIPPAIAETASTSESTAVQTEIPVVFSPTPTISPPTLPGIESELTVYRLSAKWAEEHGVTEVYELSRRIDIDCAKAIDEAIQAHKKNYDCYDLKTPAKKLIKIYGKDRMMWVLSKHILTASNKFSETNRSWAKIFINDGTGSGDEIPAFMIAVHNAILNAFVNEIRIALDINPTFNERMKSAKKKSEAHNNSNG